MSRFVSGGTDEEPTQRDEAWLKAQQELDAAAIAKQEASRAGSGKSLYETLQANKGGWRPPYLSTIVVCAKQTRARSSVLLLLLFLPLMLLRAANHANLLLPRAPRLTGVG